MGYGGYGKDALAVGKGSGCESCEIGWLEGGMVGGGGSVKKNEAC